MTYILKCVHCKEEIEKLTRIHDPACFTCKQKRKREAAINYYNLKRRKLSTSK